MYTKRYTLSFHFVQLRQECGTVHLIRQAKVQNSHFPFPSHGDPRPYSDRPTRNTGCFGFDRKYNGIEIRLISVAYSFLFVARNHMCAHTHAHSHICIQIQVVGMLGHPGHFITKRDPILCSGIRPNGAIFPRNPCVCVWCIGRECAGN